MAKKLRHECERCGLAAEFERVGKFRDDDFLELWHEYHHLDVLYKQLIANYVDSCRRQAQLSRQIDALVQPECPLI